MHKIAIAQIRLYHPEICPKTHPSSLETKKNSGIRCTILRFDLLETSEGLAFFTGAIKAFLREAKRKIET